MPQLELVTLNRTLAVMVDGQVLKVSTFIGTWRRNIRENREAEYIVHELWPIGHSVTKLDIEPPHLRPRVTIKKSSIISTQEVPPCAKR